MRVLVMCIGNLLLGDEGVGVHVARALSGMELLEGVTVLDVGTAILDALQAIEEAERIIVVDAVKADGIPGSVYRIPFGDMLQPQVIASMHGFDLSRVLLLAGRSDTPEITVIGIEPARIDWSIELSVAVQKALPAVLQAINDEIAGLADGTCVLGIDRLEMHARGEKNPEFI